MRDSTVYSDVIEIQNTPSQHTEYMWEVILYTKEGSMVLDSAKSLSITKDYRNDFSDKIKLNIFVGIGTYANKIYPFKSKLEVEIIWTPIISGTRSTVDNTKEVHRDVFKAVLEDQSSLALRAGSEMTSSIESGDRSRQIDVSFQLLDPVADEIKNKKVSGVFRGDFSPLLKSLCRAKLEKSPWSKDIDLEEVHNGTVVDLAGVDVVEVDNKKPPKQIPIYGAIRLQDLPDYIQSKYGLYTTGLGSYVERGIWYLWGSLDTNRFDNSERTLTVALIDNALMSTTDNSYDLQGKHVRMIATGNIQHVDNSEILQQNLGNGVRYLDSNTLLDNYAKTEAGKTTIDRASNMKEFIIEEREDSINTVNYSDDFRTSNHCKELSKLNERRGTLVTVNWHNSNPDVLRPGMPAKLLYTAKDDEVKALKGILVGAVHAWSTETNQYTDFRMRCNSALSFWVKRDIDEIR